MIGRWSRVFAICVLTALAGAATVRAQEAGVELRLGATTLEPGEAVDVQLICRNTGQPDAAPKANVPDGLRLELTNPTPSVFQSMSFVNGRQTSTVTYTYAMRLTALKEGTYELGPVEVQAGGASYQSDRVRVVVQASESDPGMRGDRFMFADITIHPRTVYISQTVTASLTIGMRKVEIGGRTYPLDLIRNVLSLRESQLGVFADGSYTKSETRIRDSQGQLRLYEIFRIRKEITADRVGELQVGPVFLKADYPTQLSRDWFGRLEVASSQRETARADAVTVTVLAPPDEGRPDSFNGAIGVYTMQVDAKPTHVELGQPVTLTITIQGNPLESVAGPDLASQPELASRFDFTGDELIGDIESGQKVFRRAVFPRQVGEQTIPSITWSFFNPDAQTYTVLQSDPIPITVDPSTASSATALAPMTVPASRDSGSTELKPLSGGIAPNYVDPEELLESNDVAWTPVWTGSVIIPPALWMGLALVVRRRRRLEADAGLARRKRARRAAMRRMQAALHNGHAGEQLQRLAGALTGFVTDRLDLPPGEVTPGDVRCAMVEHGVDLQLVDEVSGFLELCDAARYAPGQTSTSPSDAAKRVRTWVDRIERATA
ncbi:MAG: BatD family protein [Phycisphaerae bacterium]|nr:BatD family protein [Phycisphaerae bacterium]